MDKEEQKHDGKPNVEISVGHRLCTNNVFYSDYSCKSGFNSFSWFRLISLGAATDGWSGGSSGGILLPLARVSHVACLSGFGGAFLAEWKVRLPRAELTGVSNG